MVNFHLEGLEELENIFGENFGGFLATFGVLAAFFAILIGVAMILLWVFSSIGIMNLAKEKKIPSPWLAFLPIGRSYIVGKLGFGIYDKTNKNSENFVWITLALGAAAFVLRDSSGDLATLVKYALVFFETWAFYNMFKAIKPKNAVVYTVFTALTGTLLGGIFLYINGHEDSNKKNVKEAEIVKETVENETKSETKKEVSKTAFCPDCGAKLSKGAKFCPECGKKVEK